MIFGDDGFNLISLDDAELVQNVGVVALLFILLEGGLTTKPTDLKLAALPGILLATLGVLLAAGVTAAGVWLLLDVDLVTAGLIGAVVGSTDAAAVFSMMRTTPLPRRTAALLRVESGSNDPIAVMLTVGLIATYDQGATAGHPAHHHPTPTRRPTDPHRLGSRRRLNSSTKRCPRAPTLRVTSPVSRGHDRPHPPRRRSHPR